MHIPSLESKTGTGVEGVNVITICFVPAPGYLRAVVQYL